jgi:hypothetical protein
LNSLSLSLQELFTELRGLYKHQYSQYIKSADVKQNVRCLSKVGNGLWVAPRDGSIQIRDFQTGTFVREIAMPKTKVKSDTDKFYVNAIQQQGSKAWVGSSEGILRTYNVKGKQVLPDNDDHSGGIKCLIGSTEAIWSCSEDFRILQRSPIDGEFIKQLVGHTSWVQCMVTDRVFGYLWSGSDDGIRIWDPEPPPEPEDEDEDAANADGNGNGNADDHKHSTPIKRTPSKASVTSSRGGNSRPSSSKPKPLSRSASSVSHRSTPSRSGHHKTTSSVSGAGAGTGVAEDSKSHADADCLFWLQDGHTAAVMSMAVVDDTVWSGDKNGEICIWKAKDQSLVKKWKAHDNWVHVMALVDENVWTASFDNNISVWNKNGRHIEVIPIPTKGKVSSITYHNGRVWVGCRDPGALHLFRVYHPHSSNRVNQRIPRYLMQVESKLCVCVYVYVCVCVRVPTCCANLCCFVTAVSSTSQTAKTEIVEEEIDDDANKKPKKAPEEWTVRDMVEVWNEEHRHAPHQLLFVQNFDKDFYTVGEKKMRLVKLHGELFVRVGGGYLRMEEFVARQHARFEQRRCVEQMQKAALKHLTSLHPSQSHLSNLLAQYSTDAPAPLVKSTSTPSLRTGASASSNSPVRATFSPSTTPAGSHVRVQSASAARRRSGRVPGTGTGTGTGTGVGASPSRANRLASLSGGHMDVNANPVTGAQARSKVASSRPTVSQLKSSKSTPNLRKERESKQAPLRKRAGVRKPKSKGSHPDASAASATVGTGSSSNANYVPQYASSQSSNARVKRQVETQVKHERAKSGKTRTVKRTVTTTTTTTVVQVDADGNPIESAAAAAAAESHASVSGRRKPKTKYIV